MTTHTHSRPRLLVLRAGHLFDGGGGPLLAAPSVVVDGGRIVSVTRGPAGLPDGADIVDLPGATLLPGLVDTHVHLAFDASAQPVTRLAERDDAAAYEAMCAAARSAAAGGVTTVQDLGDRGYLALRVRAAARDGDHTLPEVVAAGVPITTPGGHCHFLGETAAGAADLRAAVRARADRGVDVIKIMASGGHMTPGSRPEVAQYSVDELRVVAEEAHRLGLRVTAHAHGTSAVVAAVQAGVDSIEHATFMTADAVDEIPAGLLDVIVSRGIALSLTFGTRVLDGQTVPPSIATRMPGFTANAGRMRAAGARIVIGTDAGIAPVKPHFVLRHAVPQLAPLGMGGAEALHAVTARAADVIGLGHRKGRLAAGYDADILAVSGNPVAEPAAVHRLLAVYVRGKRVPGPPAGSC
ncbi:amidohydrolase family protein [Catellatospora methionotrophica]|nr:amidohydrolase family protein [Catellatospora methionotrophica]